MDSNVFKSSMRLATWRKSVNYGSSRLKHFADEIKLKLCQYFTSVVREQLKLWRLFWESRHLECPESGLARSVEDHRSRCCRKCLRYFETEDGAPEAEVRASGRRCGMEQAETCTAHRVWLLAQHCSICKRSFSSWANKNVRMMREIFLFLLWKKIFFFNSHTLHSHWIPHSLRLYFVYMDMLDHAILS